MFVGANAAISSPLAAAGGRLFDIIVCLATFLGTSLTPLERQPRRLGYPDRTAGLAARIRSAPLMAGWLHITDPFLRMTARCPQTALALLSMTWLPARYQGKRAFFAALLRFPPICLICAGRRMCLALFSRCAWMGGGTDDFMELRWRKNRHFGDSISPFPLSTCTLLKPAFEDVVVPPF
jgi:hypothetical protein